MKLRPARIDDAKILFDWRNDPVTRASSLTTDPVKWEDHCNWLKGSLQNPDRSILIAELDGVAVGTARLDFGDETVLSVTVAPDQRGRGIGKTLTVLACREVGPIVSHIKRENAPSQKMVEAAGFQLIEDGDLQLWRRP